MVTRASRHGVAYRRGRRTRVSRRTPSRDVVFRSPAVHAVQVGKRITLAYLTAALAVLGPTLTYYRKLYAPDSAALEFTTHLDGLDVHGVDLLRWDDDGRIVDFAVLVRPLRGLEQLIELMRAQLGAQQQR